MRLRRKIMKTTIRFAAVAALAVSAFAAQASGLDFSEGRYPAAVESASTLTRAQVSAEVRQAMAQGTLARSHEVYEAPAQSGSSLTRAQVREEAAAAEAAGLLNFGS
jgi:hypothetical protein